ncbi:putative molibdopterin-dependent oxidoreductase YjgC [Streptosporangium album]|uniref:Putative molibdopterin-dependent oxidoreductase YjgC n=1 Tax=Streptosporangium album TaxID=47479 RepID=A0A7W7WEH8_9ACTN|nr:putative molibdopterin-dependent oxidoreductase YjgC [Streptosporangium album]
MRVDVDGVTVWPADGASLLTAVRSAGVELPTLCHDDRLTPMGSCRTCLVRSGGNVVAACVTPAADGAVVEVVSDDLRALRREAVELIVSVLPPYALGDGVGSGELARICHSLGIAPETAQGRGGRGRDDTHPYVRLDRDLCIACGRCVRMCSEVQGTFALTLVGRGSDTVVAPGTGGAWADSDCVACGGCVDTCPTGALTEPGLPFGADAAVPARTRTTCGYCGVGCSLEVLTRDGQVTAVLPDHDGAVNHGHACVKGRFAHGFLRSPERLTRPLLRRDGRLEPVSWAEALGHVASGLRAAVAEGGPDAVAAISSSRATNEENYLIQKFMRVAIGTNNIDNCSRLCHAPSAAGLTAAFGLSGGTDTFDDVERADCLLLVGANPIEAHPVVGARLLQRVLRGARLIVADPRAVGLARYADVHLRPRPGTNVALFHGLAHVLLAEGLIDEEFLRRRAARNAHPGDVRSRTRERAAGAVDRGRRRVRHRSGRHPGRRSPGCLSARRLPGAVPVRDGAPRRRRAAGRVLAGERRHLRQFRPPLPTGAFRAGPAGRGHDRLRGRPRHCLGARRGPGLPDAGRGAGRMRPGGTPVRGTVP